MDTAFVYFYAIAIKKNKGKKTLHCELLNQERCFQDVAVWRKKKKKKN